MTSPKRRLLKSGMCFVNNADCCVVSSSLVEGIGVNDESIMTPRVNYRLPSHLGTLIVCS